MSDTRQNIVERICPICGKNFVKAPQHVYVDDGIVVCKWSCLCELRRRKAAKRAGTPRRRPLDEKLKAEIIDMVINKGHTQYFTAKQLRVGRERVSLVIGEYREHLK